MNASSPLRSRTRVAGFVVVGLLAAACGSDSVRTTGAGGEEPTPVDQETPSVRDDVPSALDDPRDPSFPAPSVDPSELRSGGPPPDGIPPIDEPRFLPVDAVDFLGDEEAVLSLRIGDDARAYPMQVMTWHEIVNDTVDGIPVTVSYCPLCNTAIAYDRRLDDRILDFGTSGMLYNSALVMYDRQTESLWSHFTGEAIIGHLAGEQLELFAVATVSWRDWRDANPGGLVLSRDTGHDRRYGSNPYPGYDDADSFPFLFEGEVDGRLAAKERVLGIERGDDAVAVRLDVLLDEGVVELEVDETDLVAWALPGTASALDDSSIAEGRDVGATGVFLPVAGDRALTFARTDDGFRDAETGSTWNVLGEATSGPLAGERLERVVHVDTFWFAWGAFQPDTVVVP